MPPQSQLRLTTHSRPQGRLEQTRYGQSHRHWWFHLFTQPRQAGCKDTALMQETGRTRVPHLLPYLHTQARQGPPPSTSHLQCSHCSLCGTRAAWPARLRTQPIVPGGHTALAHVPGVHGPQPARALAPALTPPHFPSSLVFLETLLSVPLPQAGSARRIFSLSGFRPFPPRSARLRPAPQSPAGDPGHPLPRRHSRGDSRPSPGHGFSRWLRGEWGGVLP